MSDRSLDLIFYALLLVLPVSVLVARRPRLGSVIRGLFSWTLIFGAGYLLYTNRHVLPNVERVFDGQEVVGRETRIRMNPDGHFWADVRINGTSRRMLIDSGATITALSARTAEAARIDVRESPFPAILQTANGTVVAKTGTAERVRIGSVHTRDLGVVVSPVFGDMDVIGMNFLSRLQSWRVEGRTLILTPKPA